MNAHGHCCLVLHTHLPYVHHPEYDDFLEEDWLFEAMTEVYLPLLFVLRDLERDDVASPLTIGMTPPVVHMLRTPDLQKKFRRYVDKRLDLCRKEVRLLAGQGRRLAAAEHYVRRFDQIVDLFDEVDGDITAAFADLLRRGRIDILASSATHAMLPLLATDEAVRAQVHLGVEHHEQVFGVTPSGFWLPECAWRPGLERPLGDAGIRFVIFESHGVTSAMPTPPAGVHQPLDVGGVVAFGRDPSSSREVWSAEVGYPGDPEYRELYRDLGFDGDYEHVRPYLKEDGVRRNLGVKYHRVTGDVTLHDKELWDPTVARERARVHARDFVTKRTEQARRLHDDFHGRHEDVEPVIVAPYDTELFGHWWYEGPWFIEHVFREHAADCAELEDDDAADDARRPGLEFTTPKALLEADVPVATGEAAASTWGESGFFHVWLNDKNHWVWPHLHELEKRLVQQVAEYAADVTDEAGVNDETSPLTELRRRLLRQMARELLLAQSSDWPFILTMETSTWYAEQRFREHVHRFLMLEDALTRGEIEKDDLERVERKDAVFDEIRLDSWLAGGR